MNIKTIPFRSLPFSTLFKTYTNDFSNLASFYVTNPFDLNVIKKRAEAFEFKGSRKKLVEILLQFNRPFDVDEKAIANIKQLKSDDALAVVTGQQLGLFGGPLYTFYKTIAVIHRARQLERELNRPVIPVFWLADEDHDYEEIQSVKVLGENGVKTFSLPENKSNQPVADIPFHKQLDFLKRELQEELIDTDYSDELWELIDVCFQSGETFLKGLGTFISKLFSHHGLVLAGSNNRPVKEYTKDVLLQSVKKVESVDKALSEKTDELKDIFHQQVTLNSSHLFYLSDKNERIKITRNNSGWHAGNNKHWERDELVRAIENNPEKFSPDVFLRPIVQDQLLPTLGYVAGPGEAAYYGQMKSFYNVFEMTMPVIFPRFSATLIEPAIDRIFNELPFEIAEYQQRIEDLEKDFAKQSATIDIEKIFSTWKEEIDDLETSHSTIIHKIDETLNGTSKKAQAHYLNELDKLKNKTYRAVKKNKKIQVKRIHRIQKNLFPERNLQERSLSGIFYMNKFGIDIWDRLLNNIDNEGQFNNHKLIYL